MSTEPPTPLVIASVAEDLAKCLSPDLLKRGYKGYCYIYAEALYHLVGKDLGYRPKCLRLPGEETHWWLEDPQDCEHLYDVTAPCLPFPYAQGKGKGFLTKRPSKRAYLLMQRYLALSH